MDSLTAVREFKTLALDPKTADSLVKDSCIVGSLVLFLGKQDPLLVQETLVTFNLLSQTADHRRCLRASIGLLQSLRNIQHNGLHDADIRKLAGEVYRRLDVANAMDLEHGGVIRRGAPRISLGQSKSPFLGKHNKKARSLTFYMDGLDKESRLVMEDALIKVTGVVSFTFDMSRQRCTIRMRPELSSATVAQALFNAGLPPPQQVVKNEAGEEEFVTFCCSRPSSPLPEYLPEQDPEVEDPTTAVRSTGIGGDLDQNSWFNATVNYLARSMYW
jgi:armadillo repeat-containing protein 1